MTDTRTGTNHTDSTSESERVRSEIDDTRDQLGQTVEAIGDRVMPGRIIERKKEDTAQSFRRLRERIMGSAHDSRDHLADTASSTADHIREAPQSLAHRTEGSPLAAGGVAFAIGLLAAAIWRPTTSERHLVEKVADAAPGLTEGIAEAGREAAESMKEQASGAVEEVKSTVSDAVAAVKTTASGDSQAGAHGATSGSPN
jgi:ElaB/YqjD/DUF883 family membrane-anchored ribosome-binding protein